MSTERPASQLREEITSFIKENYTFDPKLVDEMIVDSMTVTEISDYKRLAAFLTGRAMATARDFGISKISDEDYPGYHLPTLIAAVKKIESFLPEEQRRMSLPNEVKIYAMAEFTNARNLTSQGKLGIAEDRAKKGIILCGFYDELKRTPDYDRDFHPVKS